MPLHHRSQPVVIVLVDEEHAEPRMRLSRERLKEAIELFDAADRGHHEIERRQPLVGHAPYANRPCPSSPCCSPSTTANASSGRPSRASYGRRSAISS